MTSPSDGSVGACGDTAPTDAHYQLAVEMLDRLSDAVIDGLTYEARIAALCARDLLNEMKETQ